MERWSPFPHDSLLPNPQRQHTNETKTETKVLSTCMFGHVLPNHFYLHMKVFTSYKQKDRKKFSLGALSSSSTKDSPAFLPRESKQRNKNKNKTTCTVLVETQKHRKYDPFDSRKCGGIKGARPPDEHDAAQKKKHAQKQKKHDKKNNPARRVTIEMIIRCASITPIHHSFIHSSSIIVVVVVVIIIIVNTRLRAPAV